MYCVKCGVKLQSGAGSCPLCGTAVWNPEGERTASEADRRYSDKTPRHYRSSTLPLAIALTVVVLAAAAFILMLCAHLYGRLAWGGYVVTAIALFYLIVILPLWFRKANPVIFLPVDFAGIALFLLYVDLASGGGWYLSFALPVTAVTAVLLEAFVVLLRYVRGGRYFIFGGFFMLLSGYLILIELFEHVTFGTTMFLWSQFAGLPVGLLGFFLILAGIIRPLRELLDRTFFI